jgi:hypothetical protein
VSFAGLAGLCIVLLAAIFMVLFAIFHRRSPFSFRNLRAFNGIQRAARLVVEDGTRLHFSLGNGEPLTSNGASALAGLVLLRNLGEITSMSDRPPMATTGNPVLNLLAQDTLRTAHDAARAENVFELTHARLTGMTPMAYAVGAMTTIRDEGISSNVLIGSFGPEVGLLTDASNRQNASVIAASDNLPAQAVLFACTQDTLLGEELFAAGAYVQSGSLHAASLLTQDILRWMVIITLLLGAGLKMAGVW